MLGDAGFVLPFPVPGSPAVKLDHGLGVLIDDDVIDGPSGRPEHRGLDLADIEVEILVEIDTGRQALPLPFGLGVLPEPFEGAHPFRAALVLENRRQNLAAGHI